MATTIRLPDGLHEAVDAARGDVPRQRWCERALEAALSTDRGVPHAPVPAEGHPPRSASPRTSGKPSTVTGREPGPIPKGKR